MAGAHKNKAIVCTDTDSSSTDSAPAACDARQLAAATAVQVTLGDGAAGGKDDAQLVNVGSAPTMRDKIRICLPLALKYVLPLTAVYVAQ